MPMTNRGDDKCDNVVVVLPAPWDVGASVNKYNVCMYPLYRQKIAASSHIVKGVGFPPLIRRGKMKSRLI